MDAGDSTIVSLNFGAADPYNTQTMDRDVENSQMATMGSILGRAFAQPVGQALPADFLAMLAALNRAQDTPPPPPPRS
jgi:hypothetical protein